MVMQIKLSVVVGDRHLSKVVSSYFFVFTTLSFFLVVLTIVLWWKTFVFLFVLSAAAKCINVCTKVIVWLPCSSAMRSSQVFLFLASLISNVHPVYNTLNIASSIFLWGQLNCKLFAFSGAQRICYFLPSFSQIAALQFSRKNIFSPYLFRPFSCLDILSKGPPYHVGLVVSIFFSLF